MKLPELWQASYDGKAVTMVPVEPDGVVIIEASDGYAGPKTRVSNGHLFVDLDQDINANYLPPGRYALVRIGGDDE